METILFVYFVGVMAGSRVGNLVGFHKMLVLAKAFEDHQVNCPLELFEDFLSGNIPMAMPGALVNQLRNMGFVLNDVTDEATREEDDITSDEMNN